MADKPAPPIPMTYVLLGAGAVLFALSGRLSQNPALPVLLRAALLLAATALVVVSLVERLKAARWDFPSRAETAAHTAVAAVVVLLTSLFGLPKAWDSARLFFAAASLFLLAGSVLVLLPAVPRKILLTVWIAYHFTGMFVVFASIDPPNGKGPWLAKQLWTMAYRPYLQFLYLTNAYHFYSPDPGPPSLFWFAVRYEDGERRWVKVPHRADSPVGMHYQRLLALPEHSFVPNNRLALTAEERKAFIRVNNGYRDSHKYEVPPESRTWGKVWARRYNASNLRYGSKRLPIPRVDDIAVLQQYRQPTDASRRLIGSVCKALLLNAPVRRREDGSPIKPVSAKAYRLVQNCLTPIELSKGADPDDPIKYSSFYLGEHDIRGELLDEEDPFLYWYLPRVYVPDTYPFKDKDRKSLVASLNVLEAPWDVEARKHGFVLLDCLQLHAEGVRAEKTRPKEKKR